jgi:hypothetical protein
LRGGGGDGDSEEVPYPQLKLMRQLLIEIVKEESWIKVAGEARESETRESVQATSDLVVICYRYKPGKRPAICDELLEETLDAAHYCGHTARNYAVCCVAWFHADEIESSNMDSLVQ